MATRNKPQVPASGLMESAAVPEHWNADGSPREGNPLLDPGPPPPRPPQPEATYGNPVADQLFEAARLSNGMSPAQARGEVLAVDVFRQPPAVHAYKAELMSWLAAEEAYRAKRGQ